MVKRLKSIWRNQRSNLALKLFTVFAALIWYRNSADATTILIFAGLYWLWYFSPSLNNKKFMASAVINFILALAVPIFPDSRLNALIILAIVAIYGILVGVKNLIFVKRDAIYYLGQFLLIAIFSLFILLGRLDLFNEILIGTALTLLLREFYLFLAPHAKDRATLYALVSASLALQVGWVVSLAPKPIWAKVGLLTLIVFMIMEIGAQYLQGKLVAQNIKRDITMAFLGITALFLL